MLQTVLLWPVMEVASTGAVRARSVPEAKLVWVRKLSTAGWVSALDDESLVS